MPAKKVIFEKEYSKRTGENPVQEQGFFVGRKGSVSWGADYRIFFEPKEEWVVESFDKINYELTSVKKKCPYEDIDFPCLISSEELFWWLVDYGYRLGDNKPIQFDEYEKKINNSLESGSSI